MTFIISPVSSSMWNKFFHNEERIKSLNNINFSLKTSRRMDGTYYEGLYIQNSNQEDIFNITPYFIDKNVCIHFGHDIKSVNKKDKLFLLDAESLQLVNENIIFSNQQAFTTAEVREIKQGKAFSLLVDVIFTKKKTTQEINESLFIIFSDLKNRHFIKEYGRPVKRISKRKIAKLNKAWLSQIVKPSSVKVL